MKKCEIHVDGMSCSACAVHVEDAIKKVDGVQSVSVSLLTNKATVVYDENKGDRAQFCSAVQKAGYRPQTSTADNGSSKTSADSARRRVLLSFLFLIPLFALHMGTAAAHRFLPESAFAAFGGTFAAACLQLLLLLPILILNRSYFISGFRTLFRLKPIMDSLIAVGAGAAVAYSLFSLCRLGLGVAGSAHLYFESAGMILTLVSLGKYLESRARRKTSSVIEKLIDLSPRTVTVLRNEKEETISADDLQKGDLFLIRAGETAAADGTVEEGHSAVDESALTGESIQAEKNPGDSVLAGSVNRWGLLTVRATRVGRENTLERIVALVEEASASKAPIARLADKISRVFVPVVMTIALLTFTLSLTTGLGFETALSRAIAVLVISCPCALGLATPTAVTVGIGRGAEMGILIRNGEALENAGRIDSLLLDKTGTVTNGTPTVSAVRPAPGITATELATKAAAVEAGSSHPLAAAVVDYARSLNTEIPTVSDLQTVPGKGVCAQFENKVIFGGNAAFLTENGVSVPAEAFEAAAGATPLFFAENEQFLGTLLATDEPRSDSAAAVGELKKMKITPILLTGDRHSVAASVASAVGIDRFKAELLPQDKEAEVRALQANGHKIAMVGDGINDSPALARADVGMAPTSGSDIAVETADIVLMNNRLSDAVTALQLSRKVMRNIKENLFWALFYNCLGIPAASGLLESLFGIPLPPGFAAAAMSLSSICVVGNALRLKGFKPKLIPNEGEVSMKTVELKIEGMMCDHCRSYVEKALNGVEGVTATVDLKAGVAQCQFSGNVESALLEKAVIDAGYKVTAINEK